MGRVSNHTGDDDMLVVPHSVLGLAFISWIWWPRIQQLPISASRSHSMITAAVSQWRTHNKSPTLELPNYTLEAAAAERGILPSLPPEQKTIGPIHAD